MEEASETKLTPSTATRRGLAGACLSPPPLSFRLLAFTTFDYSTLHFSSLAQVPTGSLYLSPSPLLRSIGLPTSPFSLLSPSTDGLTLSFSAPLSFRLLDYLLSLSLYFPQVPTGSLYLSPSPLPFGLLDYHTLLNCFST